MYAALLMAWSTGRSSHVSIQQWTTIRNLDLHGRHLNLEIQTLLQTHTSPAEAPHVLRHNRRWREIDKWASPSIRRSKEERSSRKKLEEIWSGVWMSFETENEWDFESRGIEGIFFLRLLLYKQNFISTVTNFVLKLFDLVLYFQLPIVLLRILLPFFKIYCY